MKSSFINTITRVPTRLDTDFFRLWVDFLKPYHELPNKESELLTCFLKFRYNLSKDIINEDLLDETLMSEQTRKRIAEEMGITASNLNVLFAKLKKRKLIIDGKINKKFVPILKPGSKEYKLLILFDISDD